MLDDKPQLTTQECRQNIVNQLLGKDGRSLDALVIDKLSESEFWLVYYLVCYEPESADNNFYYYSAQDDEYLADWEAHQMTGLRR